MLFVLVVVALLLAGAGGCDKEGIRQPIQFNHNVHTQELGLECAMCHEYVMVAEYAGRPKVEICSACHEEPLTEGAEEATLIEYIQSGEEIPWQRLYKVDSHVYYSHRRHVAVARIDCVECHGEIGLSTSPPERPLKKLSMGFCIDCHEKQDVTTDCNTCHR